MKHLLARMLAWGRRLQRPLLLVAVACAGAVAVLLVLNATLGDKQIDQRLGLRHAVQDAQFLRTMGVLLGPGFLEGNQVQALKNGDEIFPAMLDDIRHAQASITFETYIFWSGETGRQFVEALSERARAGVQVRVLLDWVGGDLDDRQLLALRDSGAQIRSYNSPQIQNLARLNNRTHRKLMVVDGKVAYTGGVGIADKWRGHAQAPGNWRDSHFRIEGPVVAQVQAAFSDNWMQATGQVLHGDAFLPHLEKRGNMLAQMFTSSAGGGAESMQLMVLMSIASARHSVRICVPYFVPDEVAIATLAAASRRGVKVQVLMPGPHIDWPVVLRASRHSWGKLLQAGVEIYLYQPTMYHVKMMVVDGLWTSVGSTNFDARSLAINDEANLNVYDRAFAARQEADIEQDLRKASRYTLKDWEARPALERLLDRLAALLSPQL